MATITPITRTRPKLVDAQEVRRAYDMLATPGQVVEIRALDASKDTNSRYLETLGGYFDNFNDLLREISTIRQAMGIYITLQPCHPQLLHRAKNKLIKQKKDYSTPDKYALEYRWLPIDSDPDRVTLISSDDREHEQAIDHSRKIREALQEMGWPEPVLCDSGNGGHLLYRIDLQTDDSQLLKRVLEGLAAKFDEKGVHVDHTLFNPARIIKLYGTLACKGDNTDERPHRLSRILEVPDQLQVVSREMLEAIAVPIEEKAQESQKQGQNNSQKSSEYVKENFSLEEWIAKYGVKVKSRTAYQGGVRYLLDACAWDPSHTDNSACLFDMPDGLGAKCSHNSCQGKHWRDFRVVFEPDAYTKKQTEGKGNKKEESALARLLKIVDLAHYIKTPGGGLFARVPVQDHYELVSISEHGSGFKRWLVYQFKQRYGTAPNSDAISLAMSGVIADAEYTGEVAEVHSRIATKNGCLYLDLADDKWQCVEISPDGWKVITCPPVHFRRPKGMLPLPVPTTGGTLEDLRELISTQDDSDFKLIAAWLVGALHPNGPYAILNLNGERGSTKSKTTMTLRNLIDPNEAPTRSTPKDHRDIAVMAHNNMVIALDNLSSIPLWFSDALCRVATGSGLGTRALYTDDEEAIFSNKRPIILNGIEDGMVSQSDLLSRTIMVTLSPPEEYRTEEELNELFNELHPRILGVLLTAASTALKNRRLINVDLPRMADFAKWVTAAEPALGWEQGSFIAAFTRNQDNATSIITESSPLAIALQQFMANRESWTGYTEELRLELANYEILSNSKENPANARALSGKLKRLAPVMRVKGLNLKALPRDGKGSQWSLTWSKNGDSDSVANGSSNVANGSSNVANGPFSVAKSPANVAKSPANVANFDDKAYSEASSEDIPPLSSVANVAKSPNLSTIYPPEKFKEIEEIEIEDKVADKLGNFATFATHPSQSTVFDLKDIPSDLHDLFNEYCLNIDSFPVPTPIWRATDNGYPPEPMVKEAHKMRTWSMLRSGEERKMNGAEEAMKRTMGIWTNR